MANLFTASFSDMTGNRPNGHGEISHEPIMQVLGKISESQKRIEERLAQLTTTGPVAPAATNLLASDGSPTTRVSGIAFGRGFDLRSDPVGSNFRKSHGSEGRSSFRRSASVDFGEMYRMPSTTISLPSEGGKSEGFHSDSAESVGWPGNLEARVYVNELRERRSALSRMVNLISGTQDQVEEVALLDSARRDVGRRFMIDPHSPVRIIFDFVSFAALLYDMISLPVILAWEVNIDGPLYWITASSNLFWIIDLLVNFRTGYYQHGNLIMDGRAVASHYLRTWFVPDLLVLTANSFLLVADPILNSEKDPVGVGLLRFAKTSRMLRIFGFVRMLRVSDLMIRFFDRNCNSDLMPLLELPGLVMFLTIVNHFVGCAWWAVGHAATSDTTFRWTQATISTQGDADYESQSMLYQWATAVHWSLTQMTPGSMSVQPENSVERIFNIICLVLGTIFFSSIISRLSVKLVQFHELRSKSAKSLTALVQYMKHAEVSTNLVVLATKQAQERVLLNEQATSLDSQVFKLLPQKTQMCLHYEMHRKFLAHPLFKWWETIDPSAVKLCCHKSMQIMALNDQDMLFHANSAAVGAYVGMKGVLTYIQDPTSCAHVAEKWQDSVKNGHMISEAALWVKWTHVGTIESTGRSEVLLIDANLLKSSVEYSKVCAFVFHEFAGQFQERLCAYNDSACAMPSDVALPGSSFEEILPRMPREFRELIGLTALKRCPRYITPKTLKSLKEEISSGKSIVMLTASGTVERFVVIVAIKLRRMDGRYLCHIARLMDGKVVYGCQLPASKILEQEEPVHVEERLLEGWLAPYAKTVIMTPEVRDAERFSRISSFGIPTTYLRMIHSAKLPVPCGLPSPTSGADMSLPPLELPGLTVHFEDAHILAKPQSEKIETEVMTHTSSTALMQSISDAPVGEYEFSLNAWLTQEEIDALATDASALKLRSHLEEHRIQRSKKDAAAKLWEAVTCMESESDLDGYEGSDVCEEAQV